MARDGARAPIGGSPRSRPLIEAAGLDRVICDPDVDRVVDPDQAWERFERLGASTRSGLISLHTGEPPDEEELGRSFGPLFELVGRNVPVRIVCPTSFAAPEHIRHLVTTLGNRGVPVHFVDVVPQRMVISDAVRAVVPVGGSRLAQGSVFVTDHPLVRGLAGFAHRVFAAGVPLRDLPPDGSRLGPDSLELRVVRLLSSGVTDQVAARELGVTDRQYRRYVSRVMSRLDAHSRFQAGVKAVERGWLDA